ncbi:MauE/DoxX family redox-associated membrane protein [Paenibacillus apiarius]|uniref:MauE/DoxX family redox-associated membrane protein n=1 Tax=Paenibacillus apiarius TaxID=46240 RepID=UPI0019803E12|nr:MauE/DoxX family redox-associated membrane protein [Paenibacillus apiarius]MBN3522533.1 hypothetical protein [Paenibacillus apiarius]
MLGLIIIVENLIALLFFTTSLHKIFNSSKQLRTMNAYHIVPDQFLYPSFICFVLAEITISLTIPVTGITIYHAISISGLLSIYTFAIGYNLLRGHKDISCGCGGVLENERLRWGLVLRNLFMIMVVIAVWKVQFLSKEEVSLVNQIELAFASIIIFLLMYLFKQLHDIKKKLFSVMERLN